MSSAAAGYYGLTVALGLGIAVYFELPREPALWLGLSLRYRPRRRRQAGQDQLAVDDNDAPLGKPTRTGVFDFQCLASLPAGRRLGLCSAGVGGGDRLRLPGGD